VQTYVSFFDKPIEGVACPLEVHGWSREIFARNLHVAMLPSRFVASDARIPWWSGGPSGSGDEFDTVSRRIVFEREMRDRDDDHAFDCHRVFFTSVGYRPDDDRSFGCRRDERFPKS
jgi:hypothetical protein